MTLRQWLVHLWAWLLSWPPPNDDGHCYVGKVGGDSEWCLVCGRTQAKERDE